MRKIGIIEDGRDAKRFGNYLLSISVDSEIREDDGEYQIWVVDEDDVPRAEAEMRKFAQLGSDKKYDVAAPAAPRRKDRYRMVNARREVFDRPAMSKIPLTVSMILISIFATMGGDQVSDFLYFSIDRFSNAMPEIMRGQIWRLVTPIFLHGNFLHLAFNMLWLYQLGGLMESLEGSRLLLVFTIVTAILCNVAQYYVSGPLFVGFSGVVYAMLGYSWMMTRFKPGSGYGIPQQTVVFMMVWLVICMFGFVGNIANTSHIVGMVSGTLIGFWRSGGLKAVRRRREFQAKLKE